MPMKPPPLMDSEVNAEEAQQHLQQVKDHDAAGGRDDAHAELLP